MQHRLPAALRVWLAAHVSENIKRADLDPDVERLMSQAYGYTSNKAFVRHGGTTTSTLSRTEAEFFLEFSATCIAYVTSKLKHARSKP